MKFREANQEDLPAIIELFYDDKLGKTREKPSESVSKPYLSAFEEISDDKNNTIYVAEHDSRIIGVMQLTMISTLTRNGTKRAQIEGVRIHSDCRGQGFGSKLMQFAIEKAKESGCGIVQLTTDKSREEAHQFYLQLGFSDDHLGMKIFI